MRQKDARNVQKEFEQKTSNEVRIQKTGVSSLSAELAESAGIFNFSSFFALSAFSAVNSVFKN
jgi:hypothetical protein